MARKKKIEDVELDLSDGNHEDEFEITIDLMNKEKGSSIFRTPLDSEELPEFPGGLSSGSLALDFAINTKVGGMRWGQLLQLYGVRSGGKSTLSLGFAANCTNLGKRVIYLDLEGTMDDSMVLRAGINPSLFYYLEEDGREAAIAVERAMRAGNVGLVLIDSISVL